MSLKNISIILVSDDYVLDKKEINEFNTSVDKTERIHNEELFKYLEKICKKVIVCSSPSSLMIEIKKYKKENVIVFPNWMGELSRNRYALVPAICEAEGVKYVGGDAFTRIICADKAIAKPIIIKAGFKTPNWVSCFRENEFELIDSLRIPVVVKPSRQNSSVGISQKNLIYDTKNAKVLAKELISIFREPVIIEEFCSGREISISIIGNSSGIKRLEACERYALDDEKYFREHIFDIYMKKRKDIRTSLRSITNLIDEKTRKCCEELFIRLEKVNMLRIDGRLDDNDKFSVIELASNPLMASTSDFMSAFTLSGNSYLTILSEIIELSKE